MPAWRRRLLDLAFGGAQLAAQLVEDRAVLLEGVEGGLRLQRLRRELLHRLAVFLQLAVRADRLLRGLLGLPGGVLQRLNALVDLFELPRAIVERGNALARAGPASTQRRPPSRVTSSSDLPSGVSFAAARGQRRQHGAERARALRARR